MALNAYLKLTGETQGQINGSVTQAGREGMIMVIATSHEVVTPRDASSGLPSGRRQHAPLVVTKEIDKSSPLLYQALISNERLTEFTLQFWQPSTTGQEVQHYTIRLTNATVAGIRHEMLNNKYPENMQHKEREHVSFCYQKVEWVWMDGGITATDDWEAPAP